MDFHLIQVLTRPRLNVHMLKSQFNRSCSAGFFFSFHFIFLLNAVISRLADADANANAVPCCLIPRQIL